MTFKRKKRILLSLLLCLALLCAGPASPIGVYASLDDEGEYEEEEYIEGEDDFEEDFDEPVDSENATIEKLQNELAEVNDKLKDIQEQQKELERARNQTQSEKNEAVAVRNDFGNKISLTEREISELSTRIALLEEEILLREEAIDDKQGEIDYNYDLFKKRVRAKNMQDNGTALGLLLGVDSFSEFLTRTEDMTRIARHDQNLMEKLTQERIEIEDEKTELESTKIQVEGDKAETEAKKRDLAVMYQEASNQVHSLAEQEAAFNADLEKNKARQKQMKEEIDRIYREIEFSKNPYAGGQMAWPMPGFTQISSYYGLRFGGSDFHTGTDITGSGCMGASIVAANDGIVAFTAYGTTGYGIYVMLDHGVNDNGQSVSTLYAHCSQLLVSNGQAVKRGETIAKCGSTGWSTGPHVHFEVRLDGSHVNSLPYIT